MSLADLQQVTQVSLPTLRKAVQELMDGQWIRIVGQAEANAGRPPNMFGLDDRHYALIGVHLQLPGMHLTTTDLTGRVLHEARMIHEAFPLPEDVLAAIAAYVLDVKAQMPQRHLLGIAIASPGFIDPESGDIILIGRVPHWHNFPICSRLSTQLGLPVRIANDIDSMAIVEFQRGGVSFNQNLIYMGFDEGVKASLFLNNELYKGALGNAGLISSNLLSVDTDDDKQAVMSIHGVNALVEQRVERLTPEEKAPYLPIMSIPDPRERFEQILQSAYEARPVCRAVVDLMNRTLTAAAANLIFIIQPHVFVIGGALSIMPPELFAELETQIRLYLPPLISHKVVIRLAKVAAPNSAALGAIRFFLENYQFDNYDMIVQP